MPTRLSDCQHAHFTASSLPPATVHLLLQLQRWQVFQPNVECQRCGKTALLVFLTLLTRYTSTRRNRDCRTNAPPITDVEPQLPQKRFRPGHPRTHQPEPPMLASSAVGSPCVRRVLQRPNKKMWLLSCSVHRLAGILHEKYPPKTVNLQWLFDDPCYCPVHAILTSLVFCHNITVLADSSYGRFWFQNDRVPPQTSALGCSQLKRTSQFSGFRTR